MYACVVVQLADNIIIISAFQKIILFIYIYKVKTFCRKIKKNLIYNYSSHYSLLGVYWNALI